MAVADLPSGWIAVTSSGWDFSAARAQELSGALGRVIGLEHDDRTMNSRAHCYVDGALEWSISHDPERGQTDLKVEGEAPAPLHALRQEVLADQTNDDGEDGVVDYTYDVPIDLVGRLCGFDLNGWIRGQAEEPAFMGLKAAGGSGGWLSRLFNR
jgi:hypothetical protein